MKQYTVKQLADLAGVSVRTLHHYDQIGLLRPHKRSKTNYRYYGPFEMIRLQQILFYRELDYPLDKIQMIIDDPQFDLTSSLHFQQRELQKKSERIQRLLHTVEKTLYQLNHETMLSDEQLYEGFASVEGGKKLREEATQRWGDQVKESEERIRQMGPEKWKQVKEEGEAIWQKFSDLMGTHSPESPEVQHAVTLLQKHLEHFYPVHEPLLRGLGQMYVSDPRFRAFYDKIKKDLADFINAAIQIYCDRGMNAG